MTPFATPTYTPVPNIPRWIRKLEMRVQSWITVYHLVCKENSSGFIECEDWLHPTLEEETGTWRAEDFPNLRELRIVIENVECKDNQDWWREVWAKLPKFAAIEFRPERVEVVIEMAKSWSGVVSDGSGAQKACLL
jgi:hypothetical protein